MKHFFLFIFFIFPIHSTLAKNITIESSSDQVNLIELYSSEGCSSCPPADEWLAALRNKPGLWSKYVPVEFHVDYWNYLGWHDDLSKKDFTTRQHTYSSLWKKTSVYTPNFVLNGQDWKPGKKPHKIGKKNVGKLKATQINQTDFEVEFHPSSTTKKNYTLYGTRLANELIVDIRAGENKGRKLKHEFVALELKKKIFNKPHQNIYKTKISLPKDTKTQATLHSVAFWVSADGIQTPIQAVGGDLPKESNTKIK